MRNLQGTYAIGIDLGGTKLETGLINESGELLHRQQHATRVREGFKQIEIDIAKAVGEIQKKTSQPITAVGIGMAGQIDPLKGVVKFAPNLKWHDVPLKEDLEQMTNLPVFITNDVRAATWGEWLYGAGKGCQDLVCLFVGTGIGGGIVSKGQMLTGASNTAGELGHIPIDLDGPICSCGNRGCFEALASGWAIAKRAQDAIKREAKSGEEILQGAKGNLEEVSAKHVIQAAIQKNALALEIIHEASKALIAGCIGIVNAFNPSKLILGGGIIKGFPDFIPWIESGVKQFALKAATVSLRVESAHFKEEAGVIGAAAWALENFAKRNRG